MLLLKEYSGIIRNPEMLANELNLSIDGLSRKEREEAILIAGYDKWGKDFPAKINGQFAFAIFDTASDLLFCARDRFGAREFFYYKPDNSHLIFGTSIRRVLEQPECKKVFNEKLLQIYLGFTYIPGPETFFEGVKKLKPGCYLIEDENGITIEPYWELTFEEDDSKSIEEWVQELSDALTESFKHVIDAGERADSFLSGGVDSSYILASRIPERAHCAGYLDQEFDESALAKETAALFGKEVDIFTVTPEMFFEAIPDFAYELEQPSGDASALVLLLSCKEVAKDASICFSGEGADEFFGGYIAYRRAKEFAQHEDPVYFGNTYIMHSAERKRLLKKYSDAFDCKDFAQRCTEGPGTMDPISWLMDVDIRMYLEGSILHNICRTSEASGLDIRMPYMDNAIADIAMTVPPRYKIDDTENKIVLRMAANSVLPDHIAYRTKLGFPVPVREWLADPRYNKDIEAALHGPIAERFFNVEELEKIWNDFIEGDVSQWRKIWAIYIFIVWYGIFFGDTVEKEAYARSGDGVSA